MINKLYKYMNKNISILLLSTIVFTFGCNERHHHVKKQLPKTEVLKTVRIHNPLSTSNNDWIYWYLINDNNTHTYYYSSSPNRVTSYSNLSWIKSISLPKELEEKEVEVLEESEIEVSDLGTDAVSEITADYSSIPEDNSLDSMEGVPDSDTITSDASDYGSNDGGSSDSGGYGGE